jgi:hypothetical protein
MRTIPLRNVRRDLAFCKLGSKLLNCTLVVGELELCYAGTASALTLRPFS